MVGRIICIKKNEKEETNKKRFAVEEKIGRGTRRIGRSGRGKRMRRWKQTRKRC